MRPDSIDPAEMSAWIDGELDPARRYALEDRLSREPEAAARLMGDLARRSALRLMAERAAPPSPAMLEQARRLETGLQRRRRGGDRRGAWLAGIGGIAAALLLAVTLRPGAAEEPPAYVDDAVSAYRTGLLRAAMPSQVETPVLDAAEVRRTMQIRLPRLLPGWRITDVQVFPSDDGPALQVMVMTPERQRLSLFAVRGQGGGPEVPETVRMGRASAAFWQHQDMSYAMIGAAGPSKLDPIAERLAANRPI